MLEHCAESSSCLPGGFVSLTSNRTVFPTFAPWAGCCRLTLIDCYQHSALFLHGTKARKLVEQTYVVAVKQHAAMSAALRVLGLSAAVHLYVRVPTAKSSSPSHSSEESP